MIKEITISRSHSGNTHVIVTLKEKLDPFAILFAQLYLGSDRKREACNFIRFRLRNDETAQILFKRKIQL